MYFRTHAGRVAAVFALLALLADPAAASVESELAFHRGVLAYGEQNYDEAQRQFEVVLADDEKDTVALHYLALIAQAKGDLSGALALYDRAVAIDPENPDLLLDRGIARMDAGRLDEARQAFAQVIALEPDRARAHLFAGIAAYRAGTYEEAMPHLAKAGELDPELLDESRYYSGLTHAFAGNLDAAAAAFGDVAQQSPQSPLGDSAQNMRRQIETPREAGRRWRLGLTGGMEYDTNPLVVGDLITLPGADSDWRGVIRLSGDYKAIAHEKGSLTAGFDGYWSFQVDETLVNLGVYNPWISGGYNIGSVRLGLRYDYAFTFIDTDEKFLSLNRVTPSVSYREEDWGISYLFYQYNNSNFLRDLVVPETFDRDGDRHVAGFNQFFFLPAPYTYVRIGAAGDWDRTDGTEFSYDGVEATVGAGYDLDYDISFNWLFRFNYRHYQNQSAFSDPPIKRDDFRYVLTVEIAKAITEHLSVSLGGAFTWNNSDVPFYQYDRQVGGVYATYNF